MAAEPGAKAEGQGVQRAGPGGRESGQISILMIGMTAITLTIIVAIVGVTAVQLGRIQLLDAADSAALDASDALAREQVYVAGLGSGVPVTDATVVRSAVEHLAARPRPSRVGSWSVSEGTGTPDGRTAVVTVTGTARIPMLSPLLEAFGGEVTITVSARARSDLVE